MQAVARVAQAGDAVYVVVETPRRPYGEECARPLHDGALRQPRRTSGRRFEYFEPEGAVGNVIARELGMRMDAGPVAVFPAHHDRLPAGGGAASEVGAPVCRVGIVVERGQGMRLQPAEDIRPNLLSEGVVYRFCGGRLQQAGEEIPEARGCGGTFGQVVGECRLFHNPCEIRYVAKIAEIGRAAYSKNTYFPSGGAETGTCGGRAVPPPRPPCGRSIPCAGKKANFFMQ